MEFVLIITVILLIDSVVIIGYLQRITKAQENMAKDVLEIAKITVLRVENSETK